MPRTYQGDTTLPVDGQTKAFRFELNVTSEDALILWLEDRSSKKQWQSSALTISDFVTSENVIPKATVAQYAKLFAACLFGEIDASTRHLRAKGAGGDRVLVVGVPIISVPIAVNVVYEFPLGLVPLERVDLLGARVRDVEEKLGDLCEQNDIRQMEAAAEMERKMAEMQEHIELLMKHMKRPRKYTRATTKDHTAPNETAVWTVDSGAGVSGISFGEDGRIRLSEPGLYALDYGFVHQNSTDGMAVAVQIGNQVTNISDSSYSPHMQTVAFHHVLKVEAKEEVYVEYRGINYLFAGSYVSVTEL